MRRVAKLLAVSVTLLLPFILTGAAAAQSSEITATICDSQGPEIVLNTPVSDSVTNLSVVPLKGTAIRTSQIEIYKDNQYEESIAIDPDDPQISSTITLSPGTNTIRIDAYFSCNQTTATLTRIITYRPDATGGNPRNTDTEIVRPGNTRPNVVSNPAKEEEQPSAIEQILDNIKENFGFDRSKDDSFVRPIRSWLILAMSLVAAFMVFAPVYFIGVLAKLFNIKLPFSGAYTKAILRIIGIILVSICTLLLTM